MINNSTAIGFVNSQGSSSSVGIGIGSAAENGIVGIGSNNNNNASSQLSSVIENLSNNSDIAALSSAAAAAAAASASSSSSSSSSLLASLSHATHKSYPPINSAYWLPSSHPSPYTVPGTICNSRSILLQLQLLLFLPPTHSIPAQAAAAPCPSQAKHLSVPAQLSIFIQLLAPCLLPLPAPLIDGLLMLSVIYLVTVCPVPCPTWSSSCSSSTGQQLPKLLQRRQLTCTLQFTSFSSFFRFSFPLFLLLLKLGN